VHGDVVSPRLLIHEGGSMNGTVKMERGGVEGVLESASANGIPDHV
jgi:hypothetical protein